MLPHRPAATPPPPAGATSGDPPDGTATPTERVDERDTMFARMARRSGTPAYDEYYARRAELRAGDDRLRALPPLCAPGTRYFDAELCAAADRLFDSIPDLQPDPADVERLGRRLTQADDPTSALRRAALDLGAVAAGCSPVDPAFVYSHKGRFDEDYGRPLAPDVVRGVRKWPTAVERCHAFWRGAGTDCGICMAVCPFSHRDTWPHRLVRAVVRRARWTHGAAVRFDDRLYGRRWRGRGRGRANRGRRQRGGSPGSRGPAGGSDGPDASSSTNRPAPGVAAQRSGSGGRGTTDARRSSFLRLT